MDLKQSTEKLRTLCELPALQTLRSALGADADLHIVGGAVRDSLDGFKLNSLDLDLASRLCPQESVQRLTAQGIKVVETGVERGTVLLPGSPKIEITTFRAPSGRNETIFSESIETDLQGRDFTINAIAFSLEKQLIFDPHSGIADLEASMLRCVGNPIARFEEDPARILRMLRFGPASGRSVDKMTLEAAALLKNKINDVNIQRIRDEFEKILMSPFPAEALRMAKELKILDIILPEMLPMCGFEQNRFHNEDVFNHSLTVLSRCPHDKIIRLAALFHDSGKAHTLSIDEAGERHFYQHERVSEEIARTIMERLRFSREDCNAVATLIAQHMRSLDCGPAGARRIMRDTGELYEKWRELIIADAPPIEEEAVFRARIERFDALVSSEKERLQGNGIDQLVINGDDLLALGYKGKELGQCLARLRDMIVDDPSANRREMLLEEARKMLEKKASD